jgi:hypothetical protein
VPPFFLPLNEKRSKKDVAVEVKVVETEDEEEEEPGPFVAEALVAFSPSATIELVDVIPVVGVVINVELFSDKDLPEL